MRHHLTEGIKTNEELNPIIWDSDFTMKPQIRTKLLSIVDEYLDASEILEKDDIIDIELLGSNANYNYHPKSDIDLHLVVNMEDLSSDPALAQIANNYEKANFNTKYNLGIKGIDVELYVEDVNAGTMSNGIFSVLKNEWLKKPEKVIYPDYDSNDEYILLMTTWRDRAKAVLENAITSKEPKQFVDSLYNLRRLSLMKDGEYAMGNYVFKTLRDEGYLQALKDRRYELASKELSLESLSFKQIAESFGTKFEDLDFSDDDEIETAEQEFSSADTSLHQVAGLFKDKNAYFHPNTLNLDYGGGKYDLASEYMKHYFDVASLVYDPFNRTPEHNNNVINQVRKNGGADTVTCANVLNVIKEYEARIVAIRNIYKYLKPGGIAYFTTYEKTGNEGPTGGNKYQLARKTADYVPEIASIFGEDNVQRKGKLIIAYK